MIELKTPSNKMPNQDRQSKNALAKLGWSLWIDGVGGFWLLEGDRLSVGGISERDSADVAVKSPWGRQVAIIERMGDDYWLRNVASQPNSDGSTATAIPLGAEMILPIGVISRDVGSGIPSENKVADGFPRLWLRKPSPLSNTVVLSVEPPHRFVTPVDAILMVDATVLIGPDRTHHIRAPRMSGAGLVMFKRGSEWWLRGSSGIPQVVVPGERIEVDDVVMMLRKEKP